MWKVDMLYNQINEALFNCLLVGQQLTKDGWEITKKDGEERLGIMPSIILTKNGISETFYDIPSYYDLEKLNEKLKV